MNIDIGGKAADKPFVLSSLQNGKCIQIREPGIFMYRHHEAQDTYSKAINPNPEQIFEHQKFFKNILKQNKFCYYAFSLEWLEVFYRWGNNDCSKKAKHAFLKEAHKQHLLRKIDLYRRIGMFKKICAIIRKRWHKSIKKTTMNPKMHHIEIG